MKVLWSDDPNSVFDKYILVVILVDADHIKKISNTLTILAAEKLKLTKVTFSGSLFVTV